MYVIHMHTILCEKQFFNLSFKLQIQYAFVYDAILERMVAGLTEVSSESFTDTVKGWRNHVSSKFGKPLTETQFEVKEVLA